MKLFRVWLRGMNRIGVGTAYGCPYVVAPNVHLAYVMVRKYLDERDLGFRKERELDRIELLAEEGDYPDCAIQLHLPNAEQQQCET